MHRIPTIGALAATVALPASGCGTAEGQAAPACPADTTALGSACVETDRRPDRLTWRESNLVCLAEGRRLPALAELQTVEWHKLRYRAGDEELGGLVDGVGDVPVIAAAEPQVYRCVAPAGAS
jgi:hypothetical protein